MMYWKRLPAHMRRGLFRLYLGVSVPWILFFLFRINDDENGYGHRYRVGSDIFALFLLPVGAVLVFYLINWILDGFKNHGLDGVGTAPSSIKSQISGSDSSLSPEVRSIFEKLKALFEDEAAQVAGLPEPFRSKVLAGQSCDMISGAKGEFGASLQNPIPVNGPLGEMIYLSNLRVIGSGVELMFHRLGSLDHIDVFELVSFDGKVWDILFFDLYHPRKSRKAPQGYRIATNSGSAQMLYGTNENVANFPVELLDAISRTYERFIGLKMRPREIREAVESRKFERPATHIQRCNAALTSAQVKPRMKETTNLIDQGRMISRILLDPDECWKDACKLREYDAPGPVATCEIAFARAAVLKEAVHQVYSGIECGDIKAGVDLYIDQAFSREETTEEILNHYDGHSLKNVAAQAVSLYEENVFPLTQLADVLAQRLSVPGMPSIEIAPLFEEVSAEAVRLLKFSQSASKTAAGLRNLNSPEWWAEALRGKGKFDPFA